jgi:ubiquinone/menaquinone biosynthesis C-methylase UbiE
MSTDYVTSTIDVYDKTAEEYTKQADTRGPKVERSQFIQSIPKHGTILDVGCGSGRDAKVFCDHGFTVTGVDLSGKLLEIAKTIAPKATFIKQDFRELQFQENSFDGIWACASLLHITHDDLSVVLKKLLLFLKPNGTFMMTVKAGSGERYASGRSLPNEKRFFSFYSKPSLKDALVSSGFRVTKIYAYNDKERHPENPKNHWWIVAFATK